MSWEDTALPTYERSFPSSFHAPSNIAVQLGCQCDGLGFVTRLFHPAVLGFSVDEAIFEVSRQHRCLRDVASAHEWRSIAGVSARSSQISVSIRSSSLRISGCMG